MTPTDKTVAEDLNPDDPAFCQWSERRFALARSVERWDVSISSQYAYLAGLPAAPGLTPPATARLARIAPLNRLAVAVLGEEFHPGKLFPSQVTGELNEVGYVYGLKIH